MSEEKLDDSTLDETINTTAYPTAEEVTGEEENTGKDKKKRTPLSYVAESIIYVALILVCVFWVPEHVIQRTIVNGESMENTLHTGESLLVEKVSYHFKDPKRYDIIVFHPNDEKEIDKEIQEIRSQIDATSDQNTIKSLKKEIEVLEKKKDEYYVKRIYGLPGETVQIKGKDIYINDKIIEDNFAKNDMDDAGIAEEPVTLAEDEYFVLGDNREVSLDSRDLGPIEKEKIAGHVILRIWPFDKLGTP